MRIGPIVAIKGATAYEIQIYKLWIGINKLKFWKTSSIGFIRWVEYD